MVGWNSDNNNRYTNGDDNGDNNSSGNIDNDDGHEMVVVWLW